MAVKLNWHRILIIILITYGACHSIAGFSQAETIVYDGYTGVEIQFRNDTLKVVNVKRKSPGDKAGILEHDIIMEINGHLVSGVNLRAWQAMGLFYSAADKITELVISREDEQNLKQFEIKPELDPAIKVGCYYEYLVDSSGMWTLDDILGDSINSLFKYPVDKKVLIHSVEDGSNADNTGILPGDEITGFYNEVDNSYTESDIFWGYLEWDITRDLSTDTMLTIVRNTDTLNIQADIRMDPLEGIYSQYAHDLQGLHIWLKLTLNNRLTTDRNYLLEFLWADSVNVIDLRGEEGPVIKTTGSAVDPENRSFKLKYRNFVDLKLYKDEVETFYIQMEWTDADNIGPPFLYLRNRDYVLDFDRKERLTHGILLGMILMIALFYFVIFLYMRDRSYLYYTISILFLTVLLTLHGGFIYEYINSFSFPAWDFAQALSILFFLLFGISYLGLRKHNRIWYDLMRISMLVIFPLNALTDTLSYYLPDVHDVFYTAEIVTIIGVFIVSGALLVPVILRIREGYKPAWLFLTALLVLTGVIAFYPAADFRIYYFADISDHLRIISTRSLDLGAITAILLFSVALGQRLRNSEREKHKAQQQIIHQLEENEKLKDKVNRELEGKVLERTREISQQKEKIMAQRDLLGEQKQEITDSITYAKRIQSAVLPSDQTISDLLPEHFVLFKPRDIVSGDFYWIKQVKNMTLVVAADCTGHGVPGAFMSMLGMSFLNEIVGRSRMDSAGEILDRLRDKVKKTLRQEGRELEQKDGMDLSLAIFDKENNELQYAGAFNPLYLLRKKQSQMNPDLNDFLSLESQTHQLFLVKGDRQPIAIHTHETSFKTHSLELRKGDSLYMFSDGYADQMGGPAGKKFMSKKFKELLLGIQEESMSSQKKILDETLENWKEHVQQVDDILVFGIKWNQ